MTSPPARWSRALDTPRSGQVHGLDEISPRLAVDVARKLLRTIDAALEAAYPQLAEMAREPGARERLTVVECSNVLDLRAWSDRRGRHDEERAL